MLKLLEAAKAAKWHFFCFTLAVSGAMATDAMGQQRIGEAATVRNQVVRVVAGRSTGLATGGPVYRAETIRTGRESSTRLVFLDQTNLAIGPVSTVTLNSFVYSGAGSAGSVGVELARGAFRFTTGVLDKRAYKINTSVATIGVRGTILDIVSSLVSSIITLVDNGAALVCTRESTPKCIELTAPGQSVIVRGNSIQRVDNPDQRFTFNSNCDGHPGLCSVTRLAAAPLPPNGGGPGQGLPNALPLGASILGTGVAGFLIFNIDDKPVFVSPP